MEPEYCPICEDIMEPDDVTGEIRCMTEHAPKGVPMPLIMDAKDERLAQIEERDAEWETVNEGFPPADCRLLLHSLRAALARAEAAEAREKKDKLSYEYAIEKMGRDCLAAAEVVNLQRDAALAAKEKAEGALCTAKSAAALAVNHLHASNETKEKVYAQVRAALSSSTPCPHAEEAKRLREAGPGAMAVIKERIRQKSVEGWTPEHDAQHVMGELSRAAAAYALNKMPVSDTAGWDDLGSTIWPGLWDEGWDKREKHSRERSLAIAAALCMAELDRLAELRRRADAGREGK